MFFKHYLAPIFLPFLVFIMAIFINELSLDNIKMTQNVMVAFEQANAELTDAKIDEIITLAKAKFTTSAQQLDPANGYPRIGLSNGEWQTTKAENWTSGFFASSLWYLYEVMPDEDTKVLAEKWTVELSEQKNNVLHPAIGHDIGFIIYNTFGHGYRLTGNQSYKEVVLQASNSLASLFNPQVGCIRSWTWGKDRWDFPVIIDNMMNLEMLFWAAKNGGERTWSDLAVSHALKTMENHVRPDGSTYQIVDYNSATGEVIKRVKWQGYSVESTWSRGQAWGIYGFTVAYRETGDRRFLNTAQKLANYFIKNLPEDYIPYWDFQSPDIPNTNRDASAAAIAASSLLELSIHVSQPKDKEKYFQAAKNILISLCSPKYLTKGSNDSAILRHSVGSFPHGGEVDVSLIYADYYFIEALLRYRQLILNPS
jgi:unsaturated chondroitin disaccharide hydrolase